MPDTIRWYESGNWPLIGAIITIVLSNGVLIWQTLRGFRLQQSEAGLARENEYNNKCIENWYSPLYALLTENELVYLEFGPPSYGSLSFEITAIAAKRWRSILKSVVYPNQKRIETILKENIAYIHRSDRFEKYQQLLLHVISSSLNDALKTELGRKYKYPSDVRIYIANKINDIRNR